MDNSGFKVEGYWYSEDTPQYPMPQPNQLTRLESLVIYYLIWQKEKECEFHPEFRGDPRKLSYRGTSKSRITGEYVGSCEFEHSGWKWPEALGPHYVLEHRVRPSQEFLNFLEYETAMKQVLKEVADCFFLEL